MAPLFLIRQLISKGKQAVLRSDAADGLEGHRVVAAARVTIAIRSFNQLTGQRSLIKTLVGKAKAAVGGNERLFVALAAPSSEVTL